MEQRQEWKRMIIGAALLAASTAAPAMEPDSTSALYQMREAERNFARASVMHGRSAAFIDNLADESAIFTTSWITNGRQFWRERQPNAVVLKWEPEYMDIAASRDFGISTGPWEAQEYRPFTPRLGAGYFLSVWKKQDDGAWKVVLDAGSTTPSPANAVHAFSFPEGADAPASNVKVPDERAVLKEVERSEVRLRTAWEKDQSAATYVPWLAPGVRMQREGHLPSSEADTIAAWIAELPHGVTWVGRGSGAARSGDMAYTYGTLDLLQDTAQRPFGHYVRIWKKSPAGEWRIAFEMMNME